MKRKLESMLGWFGKPQRGDNTVSSFDYLDPREQAEVRGQNSATLQEIAEILGIVLSDFADLDSRELEEVRRQNLAALQAMAKKYDIDFSDTTQTSSRKSQDASAGSQ